MSSKKNQILTEWIKKGILKPIFYYWVMDGQNYTMLYT